MTARLVVNVGFTKTRATSHFLYLPDREAAERAGRALARAGFRSQAGPAADGDDWLVIATHDDQYNGYCGVAEGNTPSSRAK